MIDLNPYFQKKLGETLTIEISTGEDNPRIWEMEVIAVSESPNSVYFEVKSRWDSSSYHGVVEVDLNRVMSVKSALETAYKTILTRER